MIFALSVFSSSELYKQGIFAKYYNENSIIVEASGSSKQHFNGSKQFTKPEFSIIPWEKTYDWCSNIGRSYDVHPWIIFSLKNKKIKFDSYYIRCGCCYADCCCDDEYYGCYNCCLYSWSLQVSNDNKTWADAHRVEKDKTMRNCNEKSFKLDKEYEAKYVRLIQNEPCPGYPPCIAINKFELYGDVITEEESDFISFHDDDEDISIIGHISKNANH